MGKPLRVSLSLSSLNSENRVCTRSSTASIHLPGVSCYVGFHCYICDALVRELGIDCIRMRPNVKSGMLTFVVIKYSLKFCWVT